MFKCQLIMMKRNKTCHYRGRVGFSGSSDFSGILGILATFEEVFELNKKVFGVRT